MVKAKTTTATKAVSLHDGGRVNSVFNRVSWRCIKEGQPWGKTFTKAFASEADAERFYNQKVAA